MSLTRSAPLISSIFPTTTTSASLLRGIIFTIAGVALLTLSAKAKVALPFDLVPMTMQSLVLMVIGAAYGSRLGFATGMAYLAAGAMGLPVFAGTPEKGIGLAYMVGPTAGYLAAYPVAMWMAGRIAEKVSFARLTTGFLAAHVVIFIGGYAWLAQLIGPEKAFYSGVAPFILGSVIKTLLAACTHIGLVKLVGTKKPA